MKSKKFIYLLFCLIGLSSLSASVDYKLDFISFEPLHKEYFADRNRPDSSISYLMFQDGYPDKIILNDGSDNTNKIKVWEFKRPIKPEDSMIHIKLGETIALARNTFSFDSWLSPIAFDISAQMLLQTLYTGAFDDSIGHDGIYFYGATLSVGDFMSMRIGNHHYCAHNGDAVFKSIQHSESTAFSEFWVMDKYIKADNIAIGLSIEPTSFLRVYGEYKFPPKSIGSYRPYMFAPKWKEPKRNSDYPDSYNARIVNVGVELTYPIFNTLGKTTIGYDLHMYEEGKVKYELTNGSVPTFDEDAPWEAEHNIRIAQELDEGISVEVAYHKGRAPLNNFFFQQTKYISVGMRYNPSYTSNIVNTAKK